MFVFRKNRPPMFADEEEAYPSQRNHELHRGQRTYFMDYGPLDREVKLLKPKEWWYHAETGELLRKRSSREDTNREKELGWNNGFNKTHSRKNHEIHHGNREFFDKPKKPELDSFAHLYLPYISTSPYVDLRTGHMEQGVTDPWTEMNPWRAPTFQGPPTDNEQIPKRTRNMLTHTHVLTNGPAQPFQYALREQSSFTPQRPRRRFAQTARGPGRAHRRQQYEQQRQYEQQQQQQQQQQQPEQPEQQPEQAQQPEQVQQPEQAQQPEQPVQS